jgi:hypothetical protein
MRQRVPALDTRGPAGDTDGDMRKKFEELQASHLYCNKCGGPMPVQQRLLLILPDGDLYDYLCQRCGSSVGSKTDRLAPNHPPRQFTPRRS